MTSGERKLGKTNVKLPGLVASVPSKAVSATNKGISYRQNSNKMQRKGTQSVDNLGLDPLVTRSGQGEMFSCDFDPVAESITTQVQCLIPRQRVL